MGDYIKFIDEAWKNFVENNYVDPKVRKEISESWVRCKTYGVDYNSGRGSNRYKIDVEVKAKENETLISVAIPIMKSLYNIVEGTGFAIMLTDREGYIIHIIGDKDIMKRADELNFVKGALWTEKMVGTNAIGTAMYLNKPLQTIGAEHYGKSQHSWTCSAAPINDENGNLVGCINMSGNRADAHLHTLAMVISAAQAIEKQLALTNSYNLLNTTFDSVFEGLISLDRDLKIQRINNRASEVLRLSREEALGLNIKSLIRNIDLEEIINTKGHNNIDCDFYIKSKIIKCIINVVPIKTNKEINGIVISLREARHVHKLVGKIVGYKATYNFEDFITNNSKMKSVINMARKASNSDCNILIEGESGTGKEVIAQAIHNFSKRSNKPFVAINCASIPRELVESEFFGYERGAFTGANKEGNPGKFELADGGTIFLDEIGELPLDIQSKLLRVLDNNKITRIGATYEKQLNVRVIGATNRVLKDEIRKKSFREDLYYRLSVINIKTLPLRERKEDIEPLVNSFIQLLNSNNSIDKIVAPDYIEKLKQLEWSGNVRELRNVVERDYYLSEDELSAKEDCEVSLDKELLTNDEEVISMQELEKENIEKAIYSCEGNIVKAALLLNISRATIYRKIKKYNISLYHNEKILK